MIRSRLLAVLLMVLGGVCVAFGAWLIHPAAGFIVLGVLAVLAGLLLVELDTPEGGRR